jgi:hypothetical protein
LPADKKTKYKIVEIMHPEPLAAQHYLLNASNVTNFLATSFNYESYVNSTIFYVLPVFEDVLRRTLLETAYRVRRSNYSYEILGSRLRIYPAPVLEGQLGRMFVRVMAGVNNPYVPGASGEDVTINGISGPNNVPLNNIPFSTITQPGRQWIRQYTLALSKELLGLVRSKIKSIPIPNADLTLNGDELVAQGREDQAKLKDQFKEWLSKLTNQALMEQQSTLAEHTLKQLRMIPFPLGKSIIVG